MFYHITLDWIRIKNNSLVIWPVLEAITQRRSVRKGVPRNFEKLTGKHLCQSLFFNKVVCLRPATLLKKRLWHMCLPVNFAKFLRTTFWQNTSGRLLLQFLIFFKLSLRSLTDLLLSRTTKNKDISLTKISVLTTDHY